MSINFIKYIRKYEELNKKSHVEPKPTANLRNKMFDNIQQKIRYIFALNNYNN